MYAKNAYQKLCQDETDTCKGNEIPVQGDGIFLAFFTGMQQRKISFVNASLQKVQNLANS